MRQVGLLPLMVIYPFLGCCCPQQCQVLLEVPPGLLVGMLVVFGITQAGAVFSCDAAGESGS